MNHKIESGKTLINILMEKLQVNSVNNTSLDNFLFHLFPNLQNVLGDKILLKDFLEGKNLELFIDSSNNKTYLENALLSFPSPSVSLIAPFLQTTSNTGNDVYIICTGIDWKILKDIKFAFEKNSFFVNLYNGTTNIININITKTNNQIIYRSGHDKSFYYITLFNYGFDSFDTWFKDNILINF